MSLLDREILALMRDVTDRIVIPHYRNLSAHQIEDKGGDDPVTVADRESEAALIEGLEKLAPGLPVVGEEGVHADPGQRRHLSDSCWIVDPIDGTRNYAKGQPPFGILVARAEGGVAQSGWIFDCLTGRFCAAHLGGGASIDGEPFAARTTGARPPVAAISLFFMEPTRRAAVVEHICPHYRMTDIPYCAAEQYPRLALGENDVALFERTLPWDHAAPALWLNEAGGRAARPDGSPYRVDGDDYGGLIGAATPALWDDVAARLAAMPA